MADRWVGYVGLVAFALAWVPQCLETVRAGRCSVSRVFLSLMALGSFSLTVYALQNREPVFSSLNALTTLGAVINLYYALRPRRDPLREEPCPDSPPLPGPARCAVRER